MPQEGFYPEKIHNEELRRLALEQPQELVSVLIEPNLPRRRVEMGKRERAGGVVEFPAGVVIETPQQLEDIQRHVSDTKHFLTEVLREEPHWLSGARSFVATANGEQLRTITCSPLIRAIRLNRRLRVGTP